MTDIYQWSKTASENDDADTDINWAEFQDPDTVNNSARQMMARVAEWRDDVMPSRTSTGTGNEYIVTTNGAPTLYDRDFVVWFVADKTNTGAATLKPDSLAAKPLRAKASTALAAGEVQSGTIVGAYYKQSTDEFLIINSGFAVNALGPSIANSYTTGLRVGDPVINFDTSPKPGRIRLTEGWSEWSQATYPELYQWRQDQTFPDAPAASSGMFNMPPAAGYFLRVAGTSSSIDTAGARDAGNTQSDQNKSHTHSASATTTTDVTLANNTALFSTPAFIPVDSGAAALAGQSGATTSKTVTATATSTTTVTNNADGGDEVRVKNVAVHVDVIASASQANADIFGVNGFYYKFETETTSAASTGRIRLNNASFASVTELYISETDAYDADVEAAIGAITTNWRLYLFKVGNPNNFIFLDVSAPATDTGSAKTYTVSVIDSNGSWSDDDPLSVVVMPAGVGATGSAGTDAGLNFSYDNSTVMADPGAGDVRFNNATLSSITALAFSSQSAATGNPDVSDFLATWDDSTSTVKGHIIIRKDSAPENFAIFTVSAIADNTAWLQATVAHVASAGSFTNADGLTVSFVRTGDAGAAGATGTDPGVAYTFDTDTTTTADPGTGDLRLNNATLASVTEIALDDNSAESGNPDVSAWLATLDDSSSTTKGQLFLKKSGAAENFAIYEISSITDATTHYRVTVTHVDSAGSFSASDNVSVSFFPRGDAGSGAVTSVFGRSGAVAATASDYDASQIDNDSGVTGAFVSNALDTLDSGKAASSHNHAAGDVTSGTFADARVAASNVTQHQAALTITESQISDLGSYETADADIAKTDVAQEYTKAQNFNATTLTDGANISWNAEDNQVASVTLAGNRTLDNPTNMVDGAVYILTVKQDATGSRTLSYGSAYEWPGGTAPVLSTAANAKDVLVFVSDGTNMMGVAQKAFS